MADRSEVAGAVVRAYLDELRALGVLDDIRPRLSPEAARLVDKPPMPVSWVEVRLAHEPLVALSKARGRDEVRALAHRVVGGKLGAILKPLLTTTLRLFGGTPATLFSRLDTLTAVMLRGVKFSWTADGPGSGTVGIEYPYPVDEALFATWEGMLQLGFDLAQTPGAVAQAQLQDAAGGDRSTRAGEAEDCAAPRPRAMLRRWPSRRSRRSRARCCARTSRRCARAARWKTCSRAFLRTCARSH